MRSSSVGAFRALRTRNYRVFVVGQLLNVTGSWMHSTAVAWILVGPEGDATGLGLVVALQFLPLLLLGVWAGSVADRVDRRILLVAANTVSALVALVTAVAVSAGHGSLVVFAPASLALGVCTAFETPARQSLVGTLVGPADLSSAVALNGSVMTSSRMLGAALAGVLIDLVGADVCLFVNAGSYFAAVAAVTMMDASAIRSTDRRSSPDDGGGVRDGLRYARSHPDLRVVLGALAVVGTLAINAQLTGALLARITFDAGPGLFAAFASFGALGALAGTMITARQSDASVATIGRASVVLGAFALGAAVAPGASVAVAAMSLSALGGGWYISSTSARIQLVTADAYRGRVMSLYAVLFLGTTPIGSAVVTVVTELANPRLAVAVGGVSAAATGAALLVVGRRSPVGP